MTEDHQSQQPPALETYSYAATEFNPTSGNWTSGYSFSKFDKYLYSKWDTLMRNDEFKAFLHPVDSITRKIPGKKGYIGVMCPSRADKKRPTVSFNKVLEQFNLEQFHFGKVGLVETLFKIKHLNGGESSIIINNSPYERCHSLMVYELEKRFPQMLTVDALRSAFEVALMSSHPGFRMLYNGICACASVNHLHFQMYYTPNYALNLETWPLRNLAHNTLFKMEDDAPLPAWVVYIDEKNYADVAQRLIQFTDLLLKQNIAHNLAVIREAETGKLRVFLWARKPTVGTRDYSEFHVAVTELVGHCYYGEEEKWSSDTEVEIESELKQFALDDQTYQTLSNELARLMDPSPRGLLGWLIG